jgi:hypothetical protein
LCRQNGKGDGKGDRRAYRKVNEKGDRRACRKVNEKGDRKVNGKGDRREGRKENGKYWNLSMRDTPLRRSESGLPAWGSPRRVKDEYKPGRSRAGAANDFALKRNKLPAPLRFG